MHTMHIVSMDGRYSSHGSVNQGAPIEENSLLLSLFPTIVCVDLASAAVKWCWQDA